MATRKLYWPWPSSLDLFIHQPPQLPADGWICGQRLWTTSWTSWVGTTFSSAVSPSPWLTTNLPMGLLAMSINPSHHRLLVCWFNLTSHADNAPPMALPECLCPYADVRWPHNHHQMQRNLCRNLPSADTWPNWTAWTWSLLVEYGFDTLGLGFGPTENRQLWCASMNTALAAAEHPLANNYIDANFGWHVTHQILI